MHLMMLSIITLTTRTTYNSLGINIIFKEKPKKNYTFEIKILLVHEKVYNLN